MTNFKKFLAVLSILCYVTAGAVWQFPAIIDVPASWIGVSAKVEKAWIVRESSAKYTKEQIVVFQRASSIGVSLVDPQDIGLDNKTPAELVPVLKAVEAGPLPALVRKMSDGVYQILPMPNSMAELQKVVK